LVQLKPVSLIGKNNRTIKSISLAGIEGCAPINPAAKFYLAFFSKVSKIIGMKGGWIGGGK
jgi:hypothetical protein